MVGYEAVGVSAQSVTEVWRPPDTPATPDTPQLLHGTHLVVAKGHWKEISSDAAYRSTSTIGPTKEGCRNPQLPKGFDELPAWRSLNNPNPAGDA